MNPFVVLGMFCVAAGLVCLYSATTVLRICRFLRETVFSDRSVILHGRKIGLFMLLTGVLVLAQVYTTRYVSADVHYRIDRWYRAGNLERAERAALAYLAEHPRDERMLGILVRIYVACRRYEIARQTLLRIKSLNPDRAQAVDEYLEKLSTETVRGNRR